MEALEYTAANVGARRQLKRRVFDVVEAAPEGDALSRYFDIAIISLIVANVCALVVATMPSMQGRFGPWFAGFEAISVTIFTVEYIVRLWSCNVDARYAAPIRGRLRFAATPLATADLLAILPFFLPFLGFDGRFLRALRMLRLLRLAKLARYSASLQLFGRVLAAKKEHLIIVTSASMLLILFASSFMYLAEHAAQPDVFSSIPAAMWWAVVTLSTVGYGDAVPVTLLGRVCASIMAILGIGMFALPAGILGSGFIGELEDEDPDADVCPQCGQRLPDRPTRG